MYKKIVTVLAVYASAVSFAHATTISGQFVDQGMINGAQVFSFDITTNEDILGFSFTNTEGGGFSGNFNNQGLDDNNFDGVREFITFVPSAAGAQPGTNRETFFAFNAADLLIVAALTEDGNALEGVQGGEQSNVLEAVFSSADGVTPLLTAGSTQSIAFFSVADGVVPQFLGGSVATPTAPSVAIEFDGGGGGGNSDIPEPTSVALIGLGIAGVVARRRRV